MGIRRTIKILRCTGCYPSDLNIYSTGARRVMDATRFDQFGRWSGVVRHPKTVCLGTKDRSWGVRNVGEREVIAAPAAPSRVFFLWAPLEWDDHISHAIFFDGPCGEALIREGIVAPLYPTEAAVPGVEDGKDQRMATARHRVNYIPGTRLAPSAEIALVDHDGKTRTIALEPILKFQMKGLGYGHPQWGQGMWKGELEIGGESFDPQQLDPLAPEHLHVQQVVRASDRERTGIGVLEQICLAPYESSGFTGLFDGAKA